MASRILYVPTGAFLKFIKYDDCVLDRPALHDIINFVGVITYTTEVWEESDCCITGKYLSPESFLKFLCSPIMQQTYIPFKTYNGLPTDFTLVIDLFEVIHDSRSPNCKN